MYRGSPLKYVGAILKGISDPEGLIFNAKRQLFVANYGSNTVTVYDENGNGPLRTLSKRLKLPRWLALSSTNDLYVTAKSYVNVYLKSRQTQTKRIHTGAIAVAIDASDNLYVSGAGVVSVFAPGATKPTRTITQGLQSPTRLAIDASGNLYVANQESSGCGDVTVYVAATGVLENTITDGICTPVSLAVDSHDNLYVGNQPDNEASSVTMYAAGTGALIETIRKGVSHPSALAIDPSDNLYVANQTTPGSVTIYPPNQTLPSQTLKKDIVYPYDLAWLQ
jgi:sugar lactone lactonase YvrE